MATKTYRVLAESTGGFIVQAESEEQAQEMVLDHMHRVGTPYKSAPGAAVSVLPIGEDKILSIDREVIGEAMIYKVETRQAIYRTYHIEANSPEEAKNRCEWVIISTMRDSYKEDEWIGTEEVDSHDTEEIEESEVSR